MSYNSYLNESSGIFEMMRVINESNVPIINKECMLMHSRCEIPFRSSLLMDDMKAPEREASSMSADGTWTKLKNQHGR